MSKLIKFNWVHFLIGDDSITLAEAISEKAAAIGVRYPLMARALWDVLADVERETSSEFVMSNARTGVVLAETDYPLTADVQWWISRRDEVWRSACATALQYAQSEGR